MSETTQVQSKSVPNDLAVLKRLENACRAAMKDNASVADMAKASGWSLGYFQRIFRKQLGISPSAFVRSDRLNRFGRLLEQGHSVTDAMHEAGYSSSSRSHQAISEGMGMTPMRYRRGGHGVRMEYAISSCSLGRVLVAATSRGLCAIFLGRDDQTLRNDLNRRFFRAEIQYANEDFQTILDRVIAILDQASPLPQELSLDLIGTVFQRRVWQALQQIPSGQKVSYAELAKAIGQPNAYRAVAAACGANPLAIVVPCHRIVRSDGGLGGYRWGLPIKRKLLRREAG